MAVKGYLARGLTWALPGAAVVTILIVAPGGHRVSAAQSPAPATVGAGSGQTSQAQAPASSDNGDNRGGRRGRDFGSGGHPGGRGGPPGPPYWWRDPTIAKDLALSDRQVAQIDRLYETRSKQMIAYANEYKKQSDALDQMFRDRTVNPTEIELQASKMWSMRVEIEKTRLVMLYRINRLLSADQYGKLQAIYEQRMKQIRPQGRGGN